MSHLVKNNIVGFPTRRLIVLVNIKEAVAPSRHDMNNIVDRDVQPQNKEPAKRRQKYFDACMKSLPMSIE